MMRQAGFLMIGITLCAGCSKQSETASLLDKGTLVFEDHFDRSEIGDNWLDTGGGYRIVDGELRAKGAKNKPLWLKKKLPADARITFTARSESDAVDIKAELFGDGKSKATKASYTATSYVVILGGWNNKRSIIARMNEHGDDRQVREEPKGVRGKTYRFNIVRKGDLFSWYLDSKPFLEMTDSSPLRGPDHEYFAFNDWASEVYFDDLAVFAL
jgi:hypothetical protein